MANSASEYSIFASLQEDKMSASLMPPVPGRCTFHQNCCANLKTMEPHLVRANILSFRRIGDILGFGVFLGELMKQFVP